MRIFVMRHGQAQAMAPSDKGRELTAVGQREAEVMAKKLVHQKEHFDAIFVSPYVRAQQTAKIVKNILATTTTLTTLEFITPEDSAQQMHNYIDVTFIDNAQANVLIVSHMPLVCYLVEEFTCGQHAPLFETASIAVIDYDISTAQGRLVSHTTPNSL